MSGNFRKMIVNKFSKNFRGIFKKSEENIKKFQGNLDPLLFDASNYCFSLKIIKSSANWYS